MAGITMDPNKCVAAVFRLVPQSTFTYINIRGYAEGLMSPTPEICSALAMVSLMHAINLKYVPAVRWIYDVPKALTNVMKDCNLGGGLKQKLQQFCANASEVFRNWLPIPKPKPAPVKANYFALDLPIEYAQPSTMIHGALLTRRGTGVLDKVIGSVGAVAVIVSAVVFAPGVLSALSAGSPALVGAASL